MEFDFKSQDDKIENSVNLLHQVKSKNVSWGFFFLQWLWSLCFRERSTSFSLGYLVIRPSAVFGTRRRNVLHGAGYAWTPKSLSFDKLQEVGFSPYLSFIPILSVLSMFELNEAVRGRLIGPKPWDRIDINF